MADAPVITGFVAIMKGIDLEAHIGGIGVLFRRPAGSQLR